jgi:biotin carboxyl carrier protein
MLRLFSLARPVAQTTRAVCRSGKMSLRSFHLTSYCAAMENVPLESLGDSITTATIVEWHKKPGEAVAVDEMIATVDTDKVSVDIKAKAAGVFGKGLVAEGEEVGTLL